MRPPMATLMSLATSQSLQIRSLSPFQFPSLTPPQATKRSQHLQMEVGNTSPPSVGIIMAFTSDKTNIMKQVIIVQTPNAQIDATIKLVGLRRSKSNIGSPNSATRQWRTSSATLLCLGGRLSGNWSHRGPSVFISTTSPRTSEASSIIGYRQSSSSEVMKFHHVETSWPKSSIGIEPLNNEID